MRKELLYSLSSPYREEMKVWGYHFGKEEKSACIVGATRGNEIQQLYVCSQLIRKLTVEQVCIDDSDSCRGISVHLCDSVFESVFPL